MLNGLTGQAYERLRSDIIQGDLHPGSVLLESHLAERLSMSRTPVREALQVLAREGLIEAAPTRGYFIPQRSMDDLREFFEMREGLEGMAARYAALRVTPAELDALWNLCAVYERAETPDDWSVLGTEFHGRILRCCRNGRLAAMLESLNAQIIQTRHSTLKSVRNRHEEAVREHRAILDALARNDADAAEREARSHVRKTYQAMLTSFQAGTA